MVDAGALEKLRKKADEAVRAKNFEYAVQIYGQILSLHPDSAADRKSLRTVQRKVFLEKGGSGKLAKLFGRATQVKLEAAKLSKNPQKVLEEAEAILEKDPFNDAVLKTLAAAALEAKLEETSRYTYEDILERNDKDVDALRALGGLWYEKDRQKATEYFERVRKIVPEDRQAHQAIRDLAAKATMDQGVSKSAETGDYHDMLKNKSLQQRLEDQSRVAKTVDEIQRAIAYAKSDIQKSPKEPRHYVKLAEELVKMKSFAEAREALKKAQELDSANLTYRFKHGDVLIREFDVQIQEAQEASAKSPGDAALKEKLKGLWAQKLSTAIADFATRVQAYPTDLDMRYRYGEYLFQAGKIKEAIPELQQAVNDPRRKRQALIRLGSAFLKEGMLELAQTQLLKALEEKHVIDDEAKQIHYNLAIVYEAMKKPEKARDSYQAILQVDYNYKDVSDRMKKLNAAP